MQRIVNIFWKEFLHIKWECDNDLIPILLIKILIFL